jgi:hypothetical protein
MNSAMEQNARKIAGKNGGVSIGLVEIYNLK